MIGYQPRAVTYRGAKAKTFEVSGFTSMYDSKAQASEKPAQAPLLINLAPTDIDRPSHAALRSGLSRLGASGTIQLGNVGARQCQWIGMDLVTTNGGLAGVHGPLVWCGGELYEITALTGSFTKVLSTANLTAAGITLSINGFIGACVFFGQLVFTQLTKRPFMWNGTTGGGLTVLTNAPISTVNATASPTVYYGKLFFISTANEIQWSEENQPNVGYTAGGYNNAWQLTETGTSQLIAIIGTNEGLYYGRYGAIGVIRGAASSTFSTDGVRESVSSASGPSIGPGYASMRYTQGTLFWFDTTNRPWAWRAGLGVVPLWKRLPRQYLQEDAANAADKLTLFQVGEEGFSWVRFENITIDAVKNTATFNGKALNNASARVSLVFDLDSLHPLCWQTWTTANKPSATGGGQWVEQGGTFLGIDTVEVFVDANGYVFYRPLSSGSGLLPIQYWDHTESAPDGHAVTGTIVGPMHGWSAQEVDWHFDRVSLVVDGQGTSVASATVLTSRTPNIPQSNPQTLIDSAADIPSERAVAFGLNESGRWGRVVAEVQAGTADNSERPAIHGWRLRGYARGAAPSLP